MSNERFSDPGWLKENGFTALAEISGLLETRENDGRDALIRVLEHRQVLAPYAVILSALTQRAGLYPYLEDDAELSTADLVDLEYHCADGLDGIVLHSAQAKVYRALMDGVNVILSAPTSFGKSLLIDAMIASERFSNIVVIVPTIALIDETRRRLAKRFGTKFKVITHPSQDRSQRNIYVLTQERFVEFETGISPEFFILDEFYKLSPNNRGDERTFVLNQAFYQLFKSGAQFFLIGPNVQDITINENDLNFRFFRFDFTTVATEIRYSLKGTELENALDICRTLTEPTLIFCKSAASAFELAGHLIAKGIIAPSSEAKEMADWLRVNYHPEWILADLLDQGYGIHHGSLPRSIAYHLLRKFNEGAIRFLLCTSTIIEGVNTSAKNIIIYDNKIATKKFDQFTFNNIKGRAGRMLKHFVGHVYVLHAEPEPELPIVDFPSLTHTGAPESLLIQLDQRDLSEQSQEQLRYLHAQDILPIEVMRSNSGVEPRPQLDLATEIASNPHKYHPLLSWSGIPTGPQLQEVCRLIFAHFLGDKPRDGVASGKQLSFFLFRFYNNPSISRLIEIELANPQTKGPSDAIERVLKFLRQWCEFHFPKFLGAVERIQRSVFERRNMKQGDYCHFGGMVKHLFMHPAVTVLEEYGLPYKLTLQVLQKHDLGSDVDAIITNLHHVHPSELSLTPFETEMLNDTIDNL